MNLYVNFASKVLRRKMEAMGPTKDVGDYYDKKKKELDLAYKILKDLKNSEAFDLTREDILSLDEWINEVAYVGD